MSLFQELKRRNVFRVAAAYLVIAWLLLQVSTVLETALNLPTWFDSFIASLLLIGFPLVMLFSWAYEITPEGIKKETEVERSESISLETAKKLDIVTLVGVVGVLGIFIYQQANPPIQLANSISPNENHVSNNSNAINSSDASNSINVSNSSNNSNIPKNSSISNNTVIPAQTGTKQDNSSSLTANNIEAITTEQNSIAVLAFENMSSDKEQEYFADGISEEILNALVKANGLRVAGRTSSFSFKGKDDTIKEIGQALNVAHVLEGSVRKQGNRVRITAQLIKSDDEFHLWSETYDGTLDDIFDLQENISRQVTEELKVILKINDKRLAIKMTDSIEAYDLFLRGREAVNIRIDGQLKAGMELLEQAVALDPNFVEAWAVLAEAHAVTSGYIVQSNAEYAESNRLAEEYANKAIALNDRLALPHAVLGLLGHGSDNPLIPYEQFKKALAIEPNHSLSLRWLGNGYSVSGLSRAALPYHLKAYAIDPLSSINAFNVAASYAHLKENDKALEFYEIVGQLRGRTEPAAMFAYADKYGPEEANRYIRKVFASLPEVLTSQFIKDNELDIMIDAMFSDSSEKLNKAKQLESVIIKGPSDQWHWQLEVLLTIGDLDRIYDILSRKPQFIGEFGSVLWLPNKWSRAFRQDPRFAPFMEDNHFIKVWNEIGWPDICKPNVGTDGTNGQFTCD